MSELFDDEDDDKDLIVEDETVKAEKIIVETKQRPSDARKRLENLLEEKRLRDELEDFIDFK